MQISGSNLLLVSQQAAPADASAPGFAAALKQAAGFTPRDLTVHGSTAVPEAKPVQTAASRPGMHVDLKV